MKKLILCSVAIVTIGVCEVVALIKGVDGALMASAFTVIGVIVGFMFGKVK